MKLFQLTSICAAAMLASSAFAGSISSTTLQPAWSSGSFQQLLAHEGGEPEDASGVPLTPNTPATVAREGGEPEDASGVPLTPNMPATLARESGEPEDASGVPLTANMPSTVA